VNLINHLKLENVGLIGYSMGTLIAFNLLHKHPSYFSKAVLIATGDGLIGKPPHILSNMLPGLAKLFSFETFPSHLPSHIAAYWDFIHQLGLDKKSMIAFSQGDYPSLTAKEAHEIKTPTLIISGEKDLVLGRGQKVAETLANSKYLEIKEANHFTLATKKEPHLATIEFLLKD
jgi:pimeloyl-ACP methyl ester carboxylesterase